MHVSAATSPGTPSAPNEDWFSASAHLVVVLDGATVRTGTGCRHGVVWYVRALGAALVAEASDETLPLPEALAAAIRGVAARHPDCDLTHPGTPSAAVGVVRVEGDHLAHAVLGDVSLVLDTGAGTTVVSDDRVSRTASEERVLADTHPIGTPEKAGALVRMKHAELAARNRPGGYWIAAAAPDAARHAVVGRVPGVRRFALLSDGAARAVDPFGVLRWPDVLDTQPDDLVRLVREVEAADPLGERFPRNKASDDATVVRGGTGPAEPAPPGGHTARAMAIAPSSRAPAS
ncbi:protein phosphatase 2C domain-containing protein [Umezawaea sp.]|uniref:protein phosphatase 2C domain-containing protein n=1 Tax=Umezawaea sp. TaxID=1955258 RepID=UPI002ED565BA